MYNKHFLPGYEVWRNIAVRGDKGGVKNTPSLHLITPGRLRPLSGEQRLASDRVTVFATHKFYCQPEDIRPGDEIRKGGQVFKVKFAQDVMDMGRLMQVDLEEIV